MKKKPCTADIIMAVSTILFVGIISSAMFVLTGCSHNMEHFKCECNCDDNNASNGLGTYFECGEIERKFKVEGR